MSEQTGGCQCGAVAYRIDGKVYRLNVCHCRDCQIQSGSAFGMSLIIEPDAFQLVSGQLTTFELTADSDRTKTCAFCPVCGVRIYNRTSALMSVKAGTLNDVSQLSPDAHYWTARKQSWVALPADLPCHEFAEEDR